MKLGRCKAQSFMKRYLDDGCLFMGRLNRSPHFTLVLNWFEELRRLGADELTCCPRTVAASLHAHPAMLRLLFRVMQPRETTDLSVYLFADP